MRSIVVAVSVAVLLSAQLAAANPITDKVVRARQVPGTTHVQVTYAVDGAVATLETPLELWRDADLLSPVWTAFASFVANTGSGLVTLPSTQACDCNVALGKHTYKVVTSSVAGGMQAIVEVVEKLEEPPPERGSGTDAGEDSDVMPWDIPEPAEIQGLDCKQDCGDVGPGEDLQPAVDTGATDPDTGGLVAPDAGSRPGSDAGTLPQGDAGTADAGETAPPPADATAGGGGDGGDDGGCTAAPSGSNAPWAVMLALVVLGVLRRRR